MTTHIFLDDNDLPVARTYGSGHHWLNLHPGGEGDAIAVVTLAQARALNSAIQQIIRQLHAEAKADAALRRDQSWAAVLQ